jgi:hypothetical protein
VTMIFASTVMTGRRPFPVTKSGSAMRWRHLHALATNQVDDQVPIIVAPDRLRQSLHRYGRPALPSLSF